MSSARLRLTAVTISIGCVAACSSAQDDDHTATQTDSITSSVTIEGAIGVLTLAKGSDGLDTVRILNDDGSLWYKFSFRDDPSGKAQVANKDFQPRAYQPDYFILELPVVEARRDRFVVLVNPATGLRKHILKTPSVEFHTWEQHVLGASLVGFTSSNNPLRETPRLDARTIGYARDVYFEPLTIEGEWLQVRAQYSGAPKGWVRWRDGDSLVVHFLIP